MTPEITNGILPGDKMYSGQIISYKIKPFPGIKLEWITEIKEVSEFRYFIDEQLSGPFSMWRHEHSLIPIEGGIQMDDVLQYRVPFGVAGNIVNSILIRNKLNNLFTYRYKKLEEIFGKF